MPSNLKSVVAQQCASYLRGGRSVGSRRNFSLFPSSNSNVWKSTAKKSPDLLSWLVNGWLLFIGLESMKILKYHADSEAALMKKQRLQREASNAKAKAKGAQRIG